MTNNKSLPYDTGFEGIKGSWKAAETWHQDGSTSTETLRGPNESEALIVLETPGLKRS